MKVLIVDDHELLAETLRIALTAEGYEVSVPGVIAADVYAAAQAAPPDVVLLDLDLGGGGDGSVLIESLVRDRARVVVVSGTSDRLRLACCVEAGAFGFLSKSAPLDELLDAVRKAGVGTPLMSEAVRQDLLAELRLSRSARRRELEPFEDLTEREQYVLAQVMEGKSASDIASSSYVTEATVRTQIRGVLTKLGVRSQLAAVAAARRAGWRPQMGDRTVPR